MRGIVYYLSGTKHAVLLAVSLWALRRLGCREKVCLICTENSEPFQGMGLDGYLGVSIKMQIPLMTAEGENYRKGPGEFPRAMITKAALHRYTPFQQTIHLDADTLPLVDPAPLFDLCPAKHVLLPTRPEMNKERIENMNIFCEAAHWEWKHRDSLPVNTGVMAYWYDAPLMEAALKLAIRGATSHRIADELAMQAIYPDYPHVLVGDEWNWSPIYGTSPNPKIMHSPGGRMTLERMRVPWLAAFRDAWDNDAGGMRQWGGEEAQRWLGQSA